MSDGVELAVDILRPSELGKVVETPLPAVWSHSPYFRGAVGPDGMVYDITYIFPEMTLLLRHGYVVVAAEARGRGASSGITTGPFSIQETIDAVEMIDWLSKQPWCDGNIGMYGQSYLGMAQLVTAGEAPEALKAIFPSLSGFDLYDAAYPGGIFRTALVQGWSQFTRQLEVLEEPPPVDDDAAKNRLRSYRQLHLFNRDVAAQARRNPFRDDAFWEVYNPSSHLAKIRKAAVPVYHWGGWTDVFTKDSFLWYANTASPRKLAIDPWEHIPDDASFLKRTRVLGIEQLRWFDHWLKGVENGVLDEPPIHYALIDQRPETTWEAATQWPPKGVRNVRLNLGVRAKANVFFEDDYHAISSTKPGNKPALEFTVDSTASTGPASRWQNLEGDEVRYPDMAENDRKGISYTSDPLQREMVVVGHPVVVLQVRSTTPDADIHVYLEEVDSAGRSTYVTEGALRASHRTLSKPAFDNLGLPYHAHSRKETKDLPKGKPAKLTIDLLPIAKVFPQACRIRVTITGADAGITDDLRYDPPARISIERSRRYPSYLELPIHFELEKFRRQGNHPYP